MRRTVQAVLVVAASVMASDAGEARAQASAGPTDAEIAHIAVTANQLDIDLAKRAQAKSRNAQVLRFAETMIADHTSVIQQATALARELGVTPADNEVSRSLTEGAREATAGLEPLSGAAFDRAYMQREIAYHEAVIEAVNKVLIPGAKNAQLRALLEKVAPVLEGHLRHARQVAAALR